MAIRDLCCRASLAFATTLATTLTATLTVAVPAVALAQRVIVVTYGDAPTYQQALAGVRRNAPGAEAQAMHGERDETLAATLARAGAGTPIVALGTRASDFVGTAVPAAPAVSCMTVGDLRAPSTMPVVPLAVPLELHLPWIKRLLPEAHTIAILYDPAQNARYVAELAQGLIRAGYQPLVEAVPAPSALPRALERIANADALLAIPDTTIYAPETAKGLLLFTFRTRTPLIAYSDAWVKAGALYALEWDYAELGAHCASLATRLVSTAKPPLPPPALPRPRVSINLRTAAQLKYKWDRSALADVDRIHE